MQHLWYRFYAAKKSDHGVRYWLVCLSMDSCSEQEKWKSKFGLDHLSAYIVWIFYVSQLLPFAFSQRKQLLP